MSTVGIQFSVALGQVGLAFSIADFGCGYADTADHVKHS